MLFRSPVPGNYFGHYEQFFRQRLTDNHQESRIPEDVDNGDAFVDPGQEMYRRWMSDTDISSDCLDNASTRYQIFKSKGLKC